MEYIIVNGELYHHGVKGMKWGVRRKQKILKSAATKAAVQALAAERAAKEYESHANKIRNDKNPTKYDKERSYRLNMAISKEFARQGKVYAQKSKMYQSMKASEVSKEDIRNAKRFLNEAMNINVSSYEDYINNG